MCLFIILAPPKGEENGKSHLLEKILQGVGDAPCYYLLMHIRNSTRLTSIKSLPPNPNIP